MKARVVLAAAALAAVGGLALAAARQEGYQPPKPEKQHEFFKHFEGSWDATTEFMTEPGKPPTKGKATETCKLVCGGLFLIIDTNGEMMGMPFQGHGITGYDTLKKKYTGSWVDSMSTAIWTSEGDVDEAGKKFTNVMEGPDPMTGKPHKMKYTIEITGKDTRKMTFFMEMDGKEAEMGKIEYTRKK